MSYNPFLDSALNPVAEFGNTGIILQVNIKFPD